MGLDPNAESSEEEVATRDQTRQLSEERKVGGRETLRLTEDELVMRGS